MAAAPQDEASRVTLEAWLVTDVGVVREHNEDSAYMEPANGFFIVADGMGGHAAGEVASAMAVDTVRKTLEAARKDIETFKRSPTDAGRRGIVQLLQSAVLSAHQAVFQRGQHEADKAGMGTTLDVVLIAGPEAFVAHVGDSRTYLVRDGRSSQITTDHTVAEVLVIEGKLTIEEAQVSPLRTILVNAIGVSADVGVEMAHVTLKRGDRLLLCSDGLHDYFPIEEEIAQKLSTDAPGDALKDMVELAKTRGGHDNITGVAVQVTEVIDAVPGALDGQSTQPVDAPSNNPFAADEPTETAVVDPLAPTRPAATEPAAEAPPEPDLRSTQPMRHIADAAPADAAASDEPPSLPAPPDAGTASAGDAPPTPGKPDASARPAGELDAMSETTLDIEPIPSAAPTTTAAPTTSDAAAPDAKVAGDPGTGGDAAGHGKNSDDAGKPDPAADAKASGDGTSTAVASSDDAAPSEIATADTGRVTASKNRDN
jgi:PPM family protein phosphatase